MLKREYLCWHPPVALAGMLHQRLGSSVLRHFQWTRSPSDAELAYPSLLKRFTVLQMLQYGYFLLRSSHDINYSSLKRQEGAG